MTVVIPEMEGKEPDTQSIGLVELGAHTTAPRAVLMHATAYRDYTKEELRSMPAEELRRILLDTPCLMRSPGGATISYGNLDRAPVDAAARAGLRQYAASGFDMVSTRELAKHIHASLLSGNDEEAPSRAKVWNMPYPVLATYEYGNSTCGVLFKVPEHVAVFNSRSLNVEDHQFYCPSLLFYAHLNAAYDITWAGVSMYTIDSPDPERAFIAHLPFPNIYSSNGRICTGNMQFSGDVIGDCKSVGEACMRLVTLVLGSGWRTDLTPSIFPDGIRALWTDLCSGRENTLCRDSSRIYASYESTVRAILDILATAEGRDRFCALRFDSAKRLSNVLSAPNPRNEALV